MIVLLVRHARAGKRSKWEGDDRLRPLDKRGRKQAEGLVSLLAEYPIDRIASSPYLRCTQTVDPLAASRGLAVEERDELAEGSKRADVQRLLEELDAGCVVLCTHGDVVDELAGSELPKGSTQVLEAENGRLTPREYLAPPV
ncbi:MAG TPA: phosphoglycerate mutase family protein [Gaiellaceae bacterium]